MTVVHADCLNLTLIFTINLLRLLCQLLGVGLENFFLVDGLADFDKPLTYLGYILATDCVIEEVLVIVSDCS